LNLPSWNPRPSGHVSSRAWGAKTEGQLVPKDSAAGVFFHGGRSSTRSGSSTDQAWISIAWVTSFELHYEPVIRSILIRTSFFAVNSIDCSSTILRTPTHPTTVGSETTRVAFRFLWGLGFIYQASGGIFNPHPKARLHSD
jgi:hypothetical protein